MTILPPLNNYKLLYLALVICIPFNLHAQSNPEKFTYADTLRGMLSPLRDCYDVNYYHLDVKLNIEQQSISGSNLFAFTAQRDFTKLQFDLYENLRVDSIIYQNKRLPYTRSANAVFVTFPKTISRGNKDQFLVYYGGKPQLSRKDGYRGWAFRKDSTGKPWVTVNCEGNGASLWWPNKDHLSDEPDSMLISVSIPKKLAGISNGRLRKVTNQKDGYKRLDWFVSNPINNYDVTLNVGNYVHFDDTYMGDNGKLTLDYWVLPENLEKAKKHFEANVKPALKAFEYWFGPYPFYKDGYKLIQTPYEGMEHQSAIAYGSNFKNGYMDEDITLSGWGMKWDAIIIHETAHEWFGNSITMKDLGDMWIHESFATYAEALFVESLWGKKAGLEYNQGEFNTINNDKPIVGPYDVNKNGSMDMYSKGALLLGTIRTIIDDDEKWRNLLLGLNRTFYHQTVTYDQIVNYINVQSGKNLIPIFEQYLHSKSLPILEFTTKDGKLLSRWIADAKDFNMPIPMRIKGGKYQFITPATTYTPVGIEGSTRQNIEVDASNYYIAIRP